MYIKHKLPPVIFFVMAFCFSSYAITLQEAESMALQNNSTLQVQRLKLEAAQREKNAKWNTFFPSVSLSGGLSNSHLSGTNGSSWNWNASAGLSVGLTAGIPMKLKQMDLSFAMELTSYMAAEQKIQTEVASAFYNLIAEAENIAILEDSLELSRQQYQQTRRNYNNGLASELSMLQSQYAYLSVEPALENAKNAYKSNLAAFQTLIGSSELVIPEADIKLVELSFPETNKLVEKYVENRLDIRQSNQAVEQARLSKTMQNLNTLAPSINMSESFRFSPSGQSAATNAGDKGVNVSGSFSVSVSIPVDGFVPGSSKNLTLKSLDDTLKSTLLALDSARIQAAQDIETKVNNINQLWKSIEIARLNLSIAERAYQLSQDGYNAGLVSQTDLESSRQQMVSAMQNVNKGETSYITAIYSLAAALNISVDEVYNNFARDAQKQTGVEK